MCGLSWSDLLADAWSDKDDATEDFPNWILDTDLKEGPMGSIDAMETQFWDGLIERYLFPLEKNKEQEKRVHSELIELRNNVTFAFFMANAIFVVVVFTLQLQSDNGYLTFDLPCFNGGKITIEPIGFVFLTFFGIIMILQFLGMIAHRLGTVWHILATTHLGCGTRSHSDLIQMNVQGAIELAKSLQALKDETDVDTQSVATSTMSEEMDNEYCSIKAAKPVYNLAKKEKLKGMKSLDAAFAERFIALQEELDACKDDYLEEKPSKMSGLRRALSMKEPTRSNLSASQQFLFDKDNLKRLRSSMRRIKRTKSNKNLAHDDQDFRDRSQTTTAVPRGGHRPLGMTLSDGPTRMQRQMSSPVGGGRKVLSNREFEWAVDSTAAQRNLSSLKALSAIAKQTSITEIDEDDSSTGPNDTAV